MKKLELKQIIREEISKVLNEDISLFEKIISTLTDMVIKGEINDDDIKNLNQRLISARKQMFTAKQDPKIRATAVEKAKKTNLWKKLIQQAQEDTDKALNITDFADVFALHINRHKNKILQSKYNKKHDEILTKLASDKGVGPIPDEYKGKNRQFYA